MIPLKYYAYLAAVLALLAGSWWLHNHLVSKGVEQQREADAKALVELQHKADVETGRLQGLADAAEHAHDEELTDLRKYRIDHPLHGSLHNVACNRPTVSATGTSNQVDGGTSAESGVIQPVPSPDNREPDQLGMLDVLAGRCDAVSAQLREWQARQ